MHKYVLIRYTHFILITTHAQLPHPPINLARIFHHHPTYAPLPNLLLSKMKIPCIQPLHPQKPLNTTPRSPIRQRRKPQKPTHQPQNNNPPHDPQNSLIMFPSQLNSGPSGRSRRACTGSSAGGGDDYAGGYRAVETAREEELG
jgi:hypothetical protein